MLVNWKIILETQAWSRKHATATFESWNFMFKIHKDLKQTCFGRNNDLYQCRNAQLRIPKVLSILIYQLQAKNTTNRLCVCCGHKRSSIGTQGGRSSGWLALSTRLSHPTFFVNCVWVLHARPITTSVIAGFSIGLNGFHQAM